MEAERDAPTGGGGGGGGGGAGPIPDALEAASLPGPVGHLEARSRSRTLASLPSHTTITQHATPGVRHRPQSVDATAAASASSSRRGSAGRRMSVINAGRVQEELLQISSLVGDVKRSQALLERRHLAVESIVSMAFARQRLVDGLLSAVINNCCHDELRAPLADVLRHRKLVYSHLHNEHMRRRRDSEEGVAGGIEELSRLFLIFSGWKLVAIGSAHAAAAERPAVTAAGTMTEERPTLAAGTMTEERPTSAAGTATELTGGRIAPSLMDCLSQMLASRNYRELARAGLARLDRSFRAWAWATREQQSHTRAGEAAEEARRRSRDLMHTGRAFWAWKVHVVARRGGIDRGATEMRRRRWHRSARAALDRWRAGVVRTRTARRCVARKARERDWRRLRVHFAAWRSLAGFQLAMSDLSTALRALRAWRGFVVSCGTRERCAAILLLLRRGAETAGAVSTALRALRAWRGFVVSRGTRERCAAILLRLRRGAETAGAVAGALGALRAWRGFVVSRGTRERCAAILLRLRRGAESAGAVAAALGAWARLVRESRWRRHAHLRHTFCRWRSFTRSQSKVDAELELLRSIAPRIHPRRVGETLLRATARSVGRGSAGSGGDLEPMLLVSWALERWRTRALLERRVTRSAQAVFRRQRLISARSTTLVRSFLSWKVYFHMAKSDEHVNVTVSQLASERDRVLEDLRDVVMSVDSLSWKIERPSSRISLTQGERTEVDVALSSSGAYRGAHARWLSPMQVRAQQQQRAQKSRRERDGRTPQRRLELEMSPTLRSWQ